MTVKVTLPGEGKHKYLRFGDVYVKHNDGRLDVFRVGAKPAYSYACGPVDRRRRRPDEGQEARFVG